MEANIGTPSNGRFSGLESRVTGLHHLAMLKIVFGVMSVAFGIPTVILSTKSPVTPFISGFGIFTGIGVMLAGVFSILMLAEASSKSPSKVKCYLIALKVFMYGTVHLSFMHFAYGIWGIVLCTTRAKGCNGAEQPALVILSSVNMILGLAMGIVIIVTFVVGHRIFQRAWCKNDTVNDEPTNMKSY